MIVVIRRARVRTGLAKLSHLNYLAKESWRQQSKIQLGNLQQNYI